MPADSRDERYWSLCLARPIVQPSLIKRLAMTKTLHHRACHLCEAICGLTLETTQADAGSLAITSI